MRALLCGGGTAGHVTPAIAIAEIINKSFPESVIAFAGREGGDENTAYIGTGHHLYTVKLNGISRTLSLNSIKSIFTILKSGRIARNIIKKFDPDVIIGTGGYVCYPFISQGQRLGIPTVIHESNVYPGLVTRVLGKKCTALLLNHSESRRYLRKTNNTVIVGNPLLSDFDSLSKSEARKRLGINDKAVLLISFGGSLGANLLNDTIGELIKKTENKNIFHIHATGRKHYNDFTDKYRNFGPNVKILPYIDDMPLWLTAADIAITRSGAMTVSELCASGTPSILIPSPNVTSNHQFINADYMRRKGAAILIEEKDLTAELLEKTLFDIIKNKSKLDLMTKKAAELSNKKTKDIIRNVLYGIINAK